MESLFLELYLRNLSLLRLGIGERHLLHRSHDGLGRRFGCCRLILLVLRNTSCAFASDDTSLAILAFLDARVTHSLQQTGCCWCFEHYLYRSTTNKWPTGLLFGKGELFATCVDQSVDSSSTSPCVQWLWHHNQCITSCLWRNYAHLFVLVRKECGEGLEQTRPFTCLVRLQRERSNIIKHDVRLPLTVSSLPTIPWLLPRAWRSASSPPSYSQRPSPGWVQEGLSLLYLICASWNNVVWSAVHIRLLIFVQLESIQ